MGKKARELPSAIQHLPQWTKPDDNRVRHDQIWSRLRAAADRGQNWTVIFPNGE